jgi:hypothetical protein
VTGKRESNKKKKKKNTQAHAQEPINQSTNEREREILIKKKRNYCLHWVIM